MRTQYCLLIHHSCFRFHKLEHVSSKDRTDNFARLRKHAHWYIPSLEGYPDLGIGTTKDNSGYHHIATGRLLCPRRLRDDFDKDKEGFCRSVRIDNRAFRPDDWPSFLYQESGYDFDAVEKGLLRSPFLVSVGPSIICIHTANISIVLSSCIR